MLCPISILSNFNPIVPAPTWPGSYVLLLRDLGFPCFLLFVWDRPLPEREKIKKEKRKKKKTTNTNNLKKGGSNSPFRTTGEHGDRTFPCWCIGCFFQYQYARRPSLIPVGSRIVLWSVITSAISSAARRPPGFALAREFSFSPPQKPLMRVNSWI